MTLQELTEVMDLLQWAQQKALTDGLYVRIREARKWLERDRKLKLMDPRKAKDEDMRI